MRIVMIILVLCHVLLFAAASGRDACAQNAGSGVVSVGDSVLVANTAVGTPLGRILLIRKGPTCCALKFTEFWAAKTEKDRYKGKDWWNYARYETWYQGDGTGDFSKRNVEVKEDEVHEARHFAIGRLVLGFGGDRGQVQCGPIKLLWTQNGIVCFYRLGMSTSPERIKEYGIELAPTPWKDISEVDLHDPRITWYVYDDARERTDIPIDRLWPEKNKVREPK